MNDEGDSILFHAVLTALLIAATILAAYSLRQRTPPVTLNETNERSL